MTHTPFVAQSENNEWPGPPPASGWARFVAYALTAALLTLAAYQTMARWQQIAALRPVELHLWAEMPEVGGWQGDALRVPSGHNVALTVHGVNGVHSFALAHTVVESKQTLGPGDEQTISFVAPAPGRYVLYCTTWCSPSHWRMRTTIEVYDPEDEDAPLTYPQTAPRYAVAVAPHALDMPHLASVWPESKPDAAAGAPLATATLAAEPTTLLAQMGWPNLSPAAIFERLRGEELPGELTGEIPDEATDGELWALVAYLRQQATTPHSLAQGAALYQQNCAACHGEQGRGDGFAAPLSVGQEPDFSDLRAAAGASPALYYAKIARGGMGTGMPNWGAVFSEDALWALVDYIQTFSYSPTLPGAPIHEEK